MRFGKKETCNVIRDISEQLAVMAANADLEVLAMTLSMTRLEAENTLAALSAPKPARRKLIRASGCSPKEKAAQANGNLGAFAT